MIFSLWHYLVFIEYFTTAKRYKCNIMCLIESHGNIQKSVNGHKPVNGETISGVARPLPLNLTDEAI